jgi:hypothetical protein
MGAYGMGMAGSMYPQFAPTAAATLQQDKGKGKSRDADFEAAFAQVAASLPQAQATAHIVEVTDEEKVDEVAESLRKSTLEDAQDDVPDFKEWVRKPIDINRACLTGSCTESGTRSKPLTSPRPRRIWRSGKRSSTS